MSSDIDLKRLRHLVLLAEELNFSRAADRAHLTQAALSRSIQSVEDSLGLRLFDRSTRSVVITSAGSQVVAHAREFLAQATDFSRQIDRIAQATGGSLWIGAGAMTVNGVLRRVLPVFRRQHPGLVVHVKCGQSQVLQSLLMQDQIEFYLGYAVPAVGSLGVTLQALPPEQASVYCRADHPLTRLGKALSPAQLAGYPWCGAQAPGQLIRVLTDWLGLRPGSSIPISFTSDDLDGLRAAMLSTDVLLFTWTSWLQADLASGAIVDIGCRTTPPLPKPLTTFPCAIVQLEGRTPSPGAQALIERILDDASKQAPDRIAPVT